MKKILLALAVLAVALPTSSFAKFTLGGPEPPFLNIAGQAKFGADLDLEAGANEPFLGFNDNSISLFLTGGLTPELSYFFHHSFTDGKYTLYECYLRWQALKPLSFTVGQSKAPFGRVYNSSAARLVFKGRNPLAAFAPQYQIGIRPELELLDKKVSLHAGVYNGKGRNVSLNTNADFMYTATLIIAPLGPVPMEESAHNGYDSPVFSVAPGFYTNALPVPYEQAPGDTAFRDVTTTAYGGHGAFRYDRLAFDAAYYIRDTDDPLTDGTSQSTGLTGQAGYAFWGRLEPIARFSLIQSDTDKDQTIIEGGLNWYFNSYASRLGLNYANVSEDGATAEHVLRLYYEMQY